MPFWCFYILHVLGFLWSGVYSGKFLSDRKSFAHAYTILHLNSFFFFSSFLSHSMPIDGLSITPDFSFSFLSPLAVSSAYKFAICNSQFDGSAYHDCSVNGVFLTVFFHICELAFGHSLYSGNYRIGGVHFFSSPFYLLSHISFSFDCRDYFFTSSIDGWQIFPNRIWSPAQLVSFLTMYL